MRHVFLDQPITITFTFRDEDGALADPDTITVYLVGQSDTLYTFVKEQLVSTSTGIWTLDTSLDEPGLWVYRADGDGTANTTDEGYLAVRHSRFATLVVPPEVPP